jgi:hypothetical protein
VFGLTKRERLMRIFDTGIVLNTYEAASLTGSGHCGIGRVIGELLADGLIERCPVSRSTILTDYRKKEAANG